MQRTCRTRPGDLDDLAAMRREYARVRAGRGRPRADLAGPVAPLAARDAPRPGCPSPTRWSWRRPTRQGRPSARTVLLKGLDERGFVFFTNYDSRKATELAANPYASLVFPWHPIGRQVVVRGRVERVDRAETEAYFATRPRDVAAGRLGQPAVAGGAGPRGAGGGAGRGRRSGSRSASRCRRRRTGAGCGSCRQTVEFWQGREGRLHDRLRYRGTARRVGRGAARPVTTVDTDPYRGAEDPDLPAPPRHRHPPAAAPAVPAAVHRQRGVQLRLPVHRGRRTGADVPADRLVALGRPAGRRRAGPAGRLRASGAARSPTRWTGASCCSARRVLMWAVHARLLSGVTALRRSAAAGGCCWCSSRVQATAFAVSSPTRQAIIPRLVGPAELPAANALNTTTFNAGDGRPVRWWPACWSQVGRFAAAYAVDAVAFTVALWATFRLPRRCRRSRSPAGRGGRPDGGSPAGARSGEGFGFLFIGPPVLLLSFAIDIAAMVLAMPRSLFPEVAERAVRRRARSAGSTRRSRSARCWPG